jgi:hypothetical protein
VFKVRGDDHIPAARRRSQISARFLPACAVEAGWHLAHFEFSQSSRRRKYVCYGVRVSGHNRINRRPESRWTLGLRETMPARIVARLELAAICASGRHRFTSFLFISEGGVNVIDTITFMCKIKRKAQGSIIFTPDESVEPAVISVL